MSLLAALITRLSGFVVFRSVDIEQFIGGHHPPPAHIVGREHRKEKRLTHLEGCQYISKRANVLPTYDDGGRYLRLSRNLKVARVGDGSDIFVCEQKTLSVLPLIVIGLVWVHSLEAASRGRSRFPLFFANAVLGNHQQRTNPAVREGQRASMRPTQA